MESDPGDCFTFFLPSMGDRLIMLCFINHARVFERKNNNNIRDCATFVIS